MSIPSRRDFVKKGAPSNTAPKPVKTKRSKVMQSKISVWVPNDLKNKLDIAAANNMVSTAQFVRQAINRAVNDEV